jgi:Lrp/AsnC family transcriptional regulator, regulator for asnA, asnC and gidA
MRLKNNFSTNNFDFPVHRKYNCDMLDKTSLKILNELCHDGRYTNIELAKKLDISVVTAAKKVKALMEDGIISIKAIPDHTKMGYKERAACLGLNVDLKYIDGVCNHLMNNPLVNMVTTSFGRFDILIIVLYQDWVQFQNFVNQELYRTEGVRNIETFFVLEEEKRNTGVFSNNTETSGASQLDELDYRLIDELVKDGRPSSSTLARKIGVSKPTISRRINYLLKNDIIKILAIPDPTKIGYSANAYLLIRANINEIPRICDELSELSEVHQVMTLLNGYSILVGVYSTNTDTLHDFLTTKLANIHGILSIETLLRGNTHFFCQWSYRPNNK